MFYTLPRTANTQNRGFKGMFEFSESFVKLGKKFNFCNSIYSLDNYICLSLFVPYSIDDIDEEFLYIMNSRSLKS